jgi:hypothetical protein
MTRVELIPSAKRLTESLRDLGYDLPSAIADLVDNSIDAGARRVAVDLRHGISDAWVRVADDGAGMSPGQLEEAMRYGSTRGYDDGDLGRFGLGLKTASLSQCRRVTVASRRTTGARISARRWDLDHVASADAWELERPTMRECHPSAIEPLRRSAGTVVLWESLDRIDSYADPSGHHAQAAMARDAERVSEHLAMTFHRFLGGEVRGRRLRLTVNGIPVSAWDPYCRSEAITRQLPEQLITYEAGGLPHGVLVRPFVLPSQDQFSTPAAHVLARGPKRWNRQQGLYIYRRDRLVQGGGWNRLRTMDEHSKLARLAVDIPPLDEHSWRLSVSKMTVSIPAEVRPELRAIAAGVVSAAQRSYRHAANERNGGPPAAVEREWRLGEHWTTISQVLERELADDPDRLDRILLGLINEPKLHRRGA